MQFACTITSSVTCPAVQYFAKLSHKRYDFRKNLTEHKTCVLILSTNFFRNISHYEEISDKW